MADDAQNTTVSAGRYFNARTISDRALVQRTFALRYQVYCKERRFLPADSYPDNIETDEFDRHSVHVGAVDSNDELAGSARIVKVSALGLPLFRHCTLFPPDMEQHSGSLRVVEVGRLCVSRSYRRRVDDDAYGVSKETPEAKAAAARWKERRRPRDGVFPTVLKALYQATKRLGVTHWLVATETSLQQLLARQGLPFRQIGPENDYFGLVAPYEMDLAQFDDVIASGRFAALEAFVEGLEPELNPIRRARRRATHSDLPAGLAHSETIPAAETADAPVFGRETEEQLLDELQRACTSPAYRKLLGESGVEADEIRDFASFARLCPVLSHGNTFQRFRIDQLAAGGDLGDVVDVLTSSGHGGRFSFGVTSRQQAAVAGSMLDRAFDAAFGIASRKTLAINCLPMGVIFGSKVMTVATVSVREDMALALIQTFGSHYEQIILVGDPLFLKKLMDHAAARGLDWTRYHVHVILGEEVFGEHYRDYLGQCLGVDADRVDGAFIMSSFGVGELGLHLCFETRATVQVRRALFHHPEFARDLLGSEANDAASVPMVMSFDPLRTYFEVLDQRADGYGRLTVSMLDPARSVPLLRYQTGDLVRLLDARTVCETAARHGITLGNVPRPLIALRGRERERLPNGTHVAFYKDALYIDPKVARHLTGAVRLTAQGMDCTMDVQLAPANGAAAAALESALCAVIPERIRPQTIKVWPYGEFPFGMSLDYERKFTYYLSEVSASPTQAPEQVGVERR
jgi:phenylacetate-CoA ligase